MTEDRRIQRTRQLLRGALLELILERGYDAVTVQDITDRANLGRATLYLHYRDKEDLLLQSIEETVGELQARLEPPSATEVAQGTLTPYLIAFEHAGENATLYRILLTGHAAAPAALRVREFIATWFKERMGVALPDYKGPIPMDVVAHFVAGSLVMMLLWWLENDMPYPVEEMAKITMRLTRQGVVPAMGITPPDLSSLTA